MAFAGSAGASMHASVVPGWRAAHVARVRGGTRAARVPRALGVPLWFVSFSLDHFALLSHKLAPLSLELALLSLTHT